MLKNQILDLLTSELNTEVEDDERREMHIVALKIFAVGNGQPVNILTTLHFIHN